MAPSQRSKDQRWPLTLPQPEPRFGVSIAKSVGKEDAERILRLCGAQPRPKGPRKRTESFNV